MNRRHLPLALVAACIASACTVTLPATPPPIAGTQPVFVASGPAGKNPIIQSFTANPSNVTKGQPITFQVVAHDPNGEALQYNWSATGGMLSATTGQSLMWTPPEKPGVYTVMVTVTNGRGGVVTGNQLLTVQADGVAAIGDSTASPSFAPTTVPSAGASSTTPPSVPASPSPTPNAGFLRLEDFTKRDYQDHTTVLGLSGVTIHVKSATKMANTYYFSMSLVSPLSGPLGYFGAFKTDASGTGTQTVTASTGVYLLSFHPSGYGHFSTSYKVNVNQELGTLCFDHDQRPLPMPRANWKVPDGVWVDPQALHQGGDLNAKSLDGAVYLFKYDGTPLDLGTFELP